MPWFVVAAAAAATSAAAAAAAAGAVSYGVDACAHRLDISVAGLQRGRLQQHLPDLGRRQALQLGHRAAHRRVVVVALKVLQGLLCRGVVVVVVVVVVCVLMLLGFFFGIFASFVVFACVVCLFGCELFLWVL